MEETFSKPEEWLSREDIACRDDRLVRLRWLTENVPNSKYWTFPGGLISKYLLKRQDTVLSMGNFLQL